MEFLQVQGLPVALALRIIKRYGDSAARVVRAAPYQLIDDLFGVTFAQVDRLASRAGLPPADGARIGAGLRHLLAVVHESGWTNSLRLRAAWRLAALLQDEAKSPLKRWRWRWATRDVRRTLAAAGIEARFPAAPTLTSHTQR